MPTVDLYNLDKKKVGTVDLNPAVFDVPMNASLVHHVITSQLAARRQGTAKTKTKGEIRGGGKKPYRQKGTGNARRGSSRSPLVVGGGRTFGPQPRSYIKRTNKKMIQGAIRCALTDRVKENRVLVVDAWNLKSHKTKELFEIVRKKFELEKVLIVDEPNQNLERSGRNIPHLKILRTDGLNTYDIVKYGWLVLSRQAVESIEKRLGTTSSEESPKKTASKTAAGAKKRSRS